MLGDLATTQKRAIVKDYISSSAPDFVALIETKLSSVNRYIIKSLWSSIRIDWAVVNATHSSSAIIIMWDSLTHEAVEVFKGNFSLSVQIVKIDGLTWWLSSIYGSASRRNRMAFWNELTDVRSLCGSHWILTRDFNVYRWSFETTSPHPSQINMRRFNSFIASADLIEPIQINGTYTWSNLRCSPVLTKLDRFLYTQNWEEKFQSHQVKQLSPKISNHFPILLEAKSLKWGPFPFKFDNRWLSDKRFIQSIQTKWDFINLE